MLLLAWCSLVSALPSPYFAVYCGEMIPEEKKKIVLLLGNVRNITSAIELFFSFLFPRNKQSGVSENCQDRA
jgi:hypothetical protein